MDEADTLLDLGFRDDLEAILQYLPPTPQRQTFLFSATVSPSIQQIARKALDKNHVFINCATEDSPVHTHVSQYHTVLPDASAQIPHILRLLAHDQLTNPGHSKTIIFFPTTKQTQLFATLVRELGRKTLPSGNATRVYEMHSKKSQGARTSTSDAFRSDKTGASILITSDVSARGVDYPGVTRVIQVGIPTGTDVYVHRVGRTGRAGTMGRGDLVLLPWELGFVSSQMSAVPLKTVTTKEIAAQVDALAKTFDSDPKAFFKNVATSEGFEVRGRTNRSALPSVFPSPYAPVTANVEEEVTNLLLGLDEEAARETMVSSLGYYLGHASELRLDKHTIVDALKDWSVQALGLATPPYISAAFLAKLGVSGRSNQRQESRWGGNGSQRSGGYASSQNSRSRRDDSSPRRENSEWKPRRDSFENSSRSEGGFGRRDSNSRRAYNQ